MNQCNFKGCKGLFIDDDTLEVVRCDLCNVYETDKEAAEYLNSIIQSLPEVKKSGAV